MEVEDFPWQKSADDFGAVLIIKGTCNCSIEYSTYRPDGSIYEHRAGEAWIDKPAPPGGQLLLSADNQRGG